MRTNKDEANRKDYNEGKARKEAREAHAAKVNEWLARFPQIGALNGGKYYYTNDAGQIVEVAEFQQI